MSSKRKISSVVIAVVVGCAVFLGYQYFMVNANQQALEREDSQGVEAGMSEAASNKQGEEYTEAAESSLVQVAEVRNYVDFVQNNDAEATSNGEFVNQAVTHLVNALGTLAFHDVVAVNDAVVENLRSQLNEYTSTQSVEKPKQLKDVITTATGILQKMQTKDNIELEEQLQQLRNDADAISESEAAEQQVEDLEKFFEQAAAVLETAERNI